jgi:hypothetical protein
MLLCFASAINIYDSNFLEIFYSSGAYPSLNIALTGNIDSHYETLFYELPSGTWLFIIADLPVIKSELISA